MQYAFTHRYILRHFVAVEFILYAGEFLRLFVVPYCTAPRSYPFLLPLMYLLSSVLFLWCVASCLLFCGRKSITFLFYFIFPYIPQYFNRRRKTTVLEKKMGNHKTLLFVLIKQKTIENRNNFAGFSI